MIPAPLFSRHLAIAVAVVTALAVGACAATVFGLVDSLALVIVRQVIFVVQAIVLFLAMFLLWRLEARHTRGAALAAVAAMGGFLLLAVIHAVRVILVTPWGVPVVVGIVEIAMALAGALLGAGLFALGISVIRHHTWRGPTAATLPIAGFLVLIMFARLVPGTSLAIPYAIWSLAFLGLIAGLRTRRAVPSYGQPVSQQGAARV